MRADPTVNASRRLRWPLFALLAVFGGACAKPVEQCLAGPAQGVDYQCSLEHDGLVRKFRVHLPQGLDRTRPTPVVLAFHGGGGTSRYMKRNSGFNALADRHGFVVIYPDGYHKTWNAGACCEDAMRANIDDVGFVRRLLADLGRQVAVDPWRIFATGFSNGSMMSHRLACEMSDKLAAIVAVSGVIMVPACEPGEAVSVLVMHGTADPRSLWEGGLGDKDPSKGVRDSIPVTMDKLNTRYQCAAPDRTFLQRNAATCTERSCAAGNTVGLCRLEGAGHQWAGAKALWPNRLGPVNTDISASQVIWDFFAAHPKPSAHAEVTSR